VTKTINGKEVREFWISDETPYSTWVSSKSIHVIEYSYAEHLESVVKEMASALNAIKENTLELQPNSGHMYLANVNYCYKKSTSVLDKHKDLISKVKGK
jgi:hypothetical protein